MGGLELQIHAFLTSILHRGEWSAHAPAALPPGTHRVRGWVGRYRRGGEEKKITAPTGNRTPAVQSVV